MSSRFSLLRFRKGFTFVESLVVLALFSGFMVATSGVFISAYRSQVGSYYAELDEQSNMRASMELEHLFRSSIGYKLGLDTNYGDSAPTSSNFLTLNVPDPMTGALDNWVFSFISDGTDSSGRTKGSLTISGTKISGIYSFTDSISLPVGRTNLFVLDNFGRVTYDWVLRGQYADLSWNGVLFTPQ